MDALGGTELSMTLGRAVVFALIPAVTIGGIDAVYRPGNGLDLEHLKIPRVGVERQKWSRE